MKKGKVEHFLMQAWRVLKVLMIAAGVFSMAMIILALTSAPFWIWYGMGVKKAGIHRSPDFIVVMGGGGMPSESGLMRCWYASKVANHFTRSRIIIALPGDSKDSLSSVNQMKKEMELRGVAGERIILEDSGTNTRDEALRVMRLIQNLEIRSHDDALPPKMEPLSKASGDPMHGNGPSSTVADKSSSLADQSSAVACNSSLLIVTSPEHLYRAMLTFKKAGFLKVDGVPAFEKTIEADLSFDSRKLGAKTWVPDVGRNITIRYQFWLHMEYELLVLREYFALAYYKLQGWI